MPKYFVMKMELYPDSKTLNFKFLGMGGLFEKEVDLKFIIPITKEDYWNSSIHYVDE